eukprot:Trichotokara_eunicae@DN6263_c0_g1_i4.p2
MAKDLWPKTPLESRPCVLYKRMEKMENLLMIMLRTTYGTLARCGLGTVIVEATAAARNGRIWECDLGLWDDSQIEGHARLVALMKRHNCIPIVQIGPAAIHHPRAPRLTPARSITPW